MIVNKIGRCVELTRFFITQRFLGFTVGEEPALDEASKPAFASMLRECRFYLEYGSGGSTVMAARMNKRFISLETDPYYMRAVRAKIGELAPHQRLLYADVG